MNPYNEKEKNLLPEHYIFESTKKIKRDRIRNEIHNFEELENKLITILRRLLELQYERKRHMG
jgi:hypothetical protein